MQVRLPPAILLMGPTASGKTDLAMRLCDALPCELISVDSVMVYKGMDIGSAKPCAATLQRYPHRLIDINDPAEPYSVADFHGDALREMADTTKRQRIPLLVGGSMMYFKALMQGIADMPTANLQLRENIVRDAASRGWRAMHQELVEMDPLAAARIHPNNRQRIQRALEVCLATGSRFSSFWGLQEGNSITNWHQQAACKLPYKVIALAVAHADRNVLASTISRRFGEMLEHGLLEEVRSLFKRPDLSPDLPSIRAVGYRQVWQYLAGEMSKNEMVLRAESATRQLAKRQMTWLRSWPDLQWLVSGDAQLLNKAQSLVLNQLH